MVTAVPLVRVGTARTVILDERFRPLGPVAVMAAKPGVSALTNPVADTVATAGAEVSQVAVTGAPFMLAITRSVSVSGTPLNSGVTTRPGSSGPGVPSSLQPTNANAASRAHESRKAERGSIRQAPLKWLPRGAFVRPASGRREVRVPKVCFLSTKGNPIVRGKLAAPLGQGVGPSPSASGSATISRTAHSWITVAGQAGS